MSDLLISVKPNTFMSFAFVIIIAVGILGEVFSWPALWYGLTRNIIGFTVFVLGWALHLYCYKYHKKAHEAADHVQNVVSSGPLSPIRHPMYLDLILMYFGLAVG